MLGLQKKKPLSNENSLLKRSPQGSNSPRRSSNDQRRRLKRAHEIPRLRLSRTTPYRWFKNQKKVVLAAKVKKEQKMIGLKDFLGRRSNIRSSSCSRTWRPIDLSREIGTPLPLKICRSKTEILMEIPRGSQKDDKIREKLQTIMKSVLTKKMTTYWQDCRSNHRCWKVSTS